jgi:tetratricopeptide (TPR) repeat protein
MLYLFVLTYSIGVIAFFVNARFRLPIMPIMIIFAAYGSLYLIESFRKRNHMLVQALVVLVFAAALVNSDYVWVKQTRAYSTAFSHNTLGNAYLKLERGDAALTHYMRAEQINKEYPTQAYEFIARDVNYNMGVLLWEKGLCSRAIESLEKVSGSDEYTLTALDYLGDCYLKKNNISQAALAYRRFMTIDKDDPRGITGLARCQSVAGNYGEAVRMLLQVVDPSGPVYPPAYMALALAQRGLGKLADAVESYKDISKFSGYEKDALLSLAEIYTETRNYAAAIETLLLAQNYMPTNDQTIPQMIRQLRARL